MFAKQRKIGAQWLQNPIESEGKDQRIERKRKKE